MHFGKSASVLAAVLLAAVPVVASASPIDFFEDGSTSLSTTAANTTSISIQNGLPTNTVLGGQRVTTLTKTTGGNGNSVNASLQQGTGGAADDNDVAVQFSGSGGSARGKLLFQYGQAGDLNANFLDIGATGNDWDRIRVTFGAFSSPIDVTVSLFSRENGGNAALVQSFAGGAGNLDFLYSNFNGGAGLSDAFLRNIDQVSLSLATNSSTLNNFSVSLTSFNLNSLTAAPAATVPEPATLLLFGMALAIMVVATRRSRS